MARYSIIIRDETYVKLVSEARMKRISLGKLINQILDKWAEGAGVAGGEGQQHICIVCGGKALYVGRGKGQQRLFVCAFHKALLHQLESYAQLQP